MFKVTDIHIDLDYTEKTVRRAIASKLNIKESDITYLKIIRKAVDARKKNNVHFVLSAEIDCKVDLLNSKIAGISVAEQYNYIINRCKPLKKRPVIVGAGPAGLFAAYVLAKAGASPILLERGLDVDSRKAEIDNFIRSGKLNTECNVQFGEGGAGAFSDGKLTTGIKDKRIRFVFETFVECGAPEDILIDAKPHIGTDKLVPTVRNLRNRAIALGCEVIFGAKLYDYIEKNGVLTSVLYEKDGRKYEIPTEHCVLAVGHSARDIYELLKAKKMALEQKNFAMGVRIEHLQSEIDKAMYGNFAGHSKLKPADYKLAVHLENGRSLYTFCMCPGGYVLPSASENGGVVTNGMSYFARDGVNANSALLVGVSSADFGSDDPLAGMYMQRKLEQKAFSIGGGNYSAPVTKVGDFLKHKASYEFGSVKPTYSGNVVFADFDDLFPAFMLDTMRQGLPVMGRKIKGFDCDDALLTAVESRSSAPVRILRNTESYESICLKGMYPCGEGAGYAGGIVSAAVDGIRVAESIIEISSGY